MNIEKIKNNNLYENNNNNNLKKDDIITGSIQALNNNMYTINLENNLFINVDKNKIVGNIGDTIYFKVEDNKNTLKQIVDKKNNTQEIKNGLKPSSFNIDIKKEMINSQKKYKMFLDKNSQPYIQENNLYETKIKNKLSHISNTITKEDFQKFLNSGVNPKNVDMLTFSDYISISTGVDVEGNKKPEEKTLQELKEDKEKTMKMDLNMNGVDEEDFYRFKKALSDLGLPITDKNINTLKNVKNKIDNIENIDKETALNFIKKGNKATIEDLYTSKYSRFSNKDNVNILNIENIDIQIENILKENNIDITEENINLAKDFIKNEIDISYDNFSKYKKLQNLKNEINIQDILNKVAKNILKNENVLNVDILNTRNVEKQIELYKNVLPNISTEHLQGLINNKLPINLKNIVENYNKVDTKNITVTNEAITERLNLAKIQLKLTTEAIYNLYNKGINIDVKPLKDVISNLEQIEQETYKKYLEINKTPVTDNNITTMKDVFSTIQNLYPNTVYYVFKDIIDKNIDFSLTGINKSIKAQNIPKDFEIFKTTPNRTYGDRLNNLKGEFEKLLIENGFEPNEINIKAAKILSLNDIDFTEENILKTKLIDSKIDYVANNLHPLTVAKMLKDSFNPMDRNINDVIDYIDNNSFGQTSREKIAEQILDIDRENKLSKEERDAIVSVYRMLNIVEKGDSVAIGNLLKTEKNITLSNLLISSKTYQKNIRNIDFDKIVDENNGESETIVSENNITKSIQLGIEKANENYNKFILEQIVNYANPDKLNDIDKNITIEQLLEKLKVENKQTISNETKEEFNKTINNLENINFDTIGYLIKNNIPITINNIEIMQKMLKENIKLSKDIDEFKSELEQRGISFGESILDINDNKKVSKEEALKTVQDLKEDNEKAFDDIINLDDLDDIKYMILKNKNVKSNINFMQDINNIKNGLYTLPIKLSNGKMTDFNMYILNDIALNDKNLNLYLNFENLDNENIEAYVKVHNNGSLVDVVTQDNVKVQKNEKDILNILSKFDIYPDNIIYSINNEQNLYKDDKILRIEEKFRAMDNQFNKVV